LAWREFFFGGINTQKNPERKFMESFYDKVTHWQPFFSTVAGATATLAGLLFIALSINRDKITDNPDLLRSAKRSFGDYLFTMFIALLFLMPIHEGSGLALALMSVAVVRIFILVTVLCRSSNKKRWREQFFPALSCVGLIFVVVEIYHGEMLAAALLVVVIAFLLYNATMNAWDLLIMEKKAEVKPSNTI
jgi:TRAP-type C4-dicarboxylate transport system permease large subunit